ncbi:MAG: metal ABC transporter permease, partial [Pseudomonadota bacterium]
GGLIICASLVAVFSSVAGLLLSYHYSLPSGPAIILVAGAVYAVSVLVGPNGSLSAQVTARRSIQT